MKNKVAILFLAFTFISLKSNARTTRDCSPNRLISFAKASERSLAEYRNSKGASRKGFERVYFRIKSYENSGDINSVCNKRHELFMGYVALESSVSIVANYLHMVRRENVVSNFEYPPVRHLKDIENNPIHNFEEIALELLSTACKVENNQSRKEQVRLAVNEMTKSYGLVNSFLNNSDHLYWRQFKEDRRLFKSLKRDCQKYFHELELRPEKCTSSEVPVVQKELRSINK